MEGKTNSQTEETAMTYDLANSFIIILPHTIIQIPATSNLSWLTLFYTLPRELVAKRPEFLELPRNVYQVLSSEKYTQMINSDSFLELVWDCCAWTAWQAFVVPGKNGYREIPGNWQDYSGYFPLWSLSYYVLNFIRNKMEGPMEFGFQRLFTMNLWRDAEWMSYQHFYNLIGNLTELIVKENDWQPMIDTVWNNRQLEDYNGQNLTARDFLRKWTHSRTAEHVSIEEILETGMTVGKERLYDLPADENFSEQVNSKLDMVSFMATLSERDKLMLAMRRDNKSLAEIAAAVGYKTPSAAQKRIMKLVEQFQAFLATP